MTWLVYFHWLVICFGVAAILVKGWSWLATHTGSDAGAHFSMGGGIRWTLILVVLVAVTRVDLGAYNGLVTLVADVGIVIAALALFRSALWTLDLDRGGR